MTSSWPRPAESSAPAEPGDADLVRVAIAGNRIAFDALHRRHARAVHGVALANGAARDADDVVQEAFLVAWRRLGMLRDPASFGPWLLAIARHAARRTASRAVDEPLPDGLVGPRLDGERDGAEIVAMLRALPAAYRETLALRLVEGLSGPEIAAATGLTHGSVRVNLHRGMQILREKLRAEGFA